MTTRFWFRLTAHAWSRAAGALLLAAPVLLAQQPATASGSAGVTKTPTQAELTTRQLALLDRTVAPALRKVLTARPCVSWEQSKLHSYLPRSRIAAGAAAGVTLRLNQKLGVYVAGDTLSSLLTLSNAPSATPDYLSPYLILTRGGGAESCEARLARQILASSRNDLQPQDVLGLAMDVCGNDYWLATLTAHNLLKECTYAARSKGSMSQAQIGFSSTDPTAPDVRIPASKLVAKLAQLRPTGGTFLDDKMGPWYHLFGAFFVAGFTGSTEMEMVAYVVELRSNAADVFKIQLNYWAARQSVSLNQLLAQPPPVLAPLAGVASEDAVRLAVMGTFTAKPSDEEIAAALREYLSRQPKNVTLLAGPLKMRATWWNTPDEANKVVLYIQSAATPPQTPQQYAILLKYDLLQQAYHFSGVLMPGVKRSVDDKNTASMLMPKDLVYLRDGWLEDRPPAAPSPTTATAPVPPAQPESAIVYGIVRDARTEQPLADVAVSVLRPGRTCAAWIQAGFPGDWMLAQAVSDQNGQFNFPESLPRATTLSLVAARFAYSPLRYDALVITREAPDPVKLNLRLTPAP